MGKSYVEARNGIYQAGVLPQEDEHHVAFAAFLATYLRSESISFHGLHSQYLLPYLRLPGLMCLSLASTFSLHLSVHLPICACITFVLHYLPVQYYVENSCIPNQQQDQTRVLA